MNLLLTPIILAAGASSRMGRPKALLEIGGRLAIDRVLDAAAEAGLGRAIVVIGAEADHLEAHADLSRATVVRNAGWAKGMTSSVQCGLRSLPAGSQGFFVWPVDLPLVPPSTLADLATRFWILRQNRRDPIVVPKSTRRGHPVLFDRRYVDEILALRMEDPPRVVVERHPDQVEEIAAGEETVRDLDTPEDYARVTARH